MASVRGGPSPEEQLSPYRLTLAARHPRWVDDHGVLASRGGLGERCYAAGPNELPEPPPAATADTKTLPSIGWQPPPALRTKRGKWPEAVGAGIFFV